MAPDALAQRLTIAVPTYNGAAHLDACLSSAVATGARVIVSDDGSTDATGEILARYADRAEIVEQGINRGIGFNYQYLLDRCETGHALFLNQDDAILDQRAFQRSLRFADHVVILNGWVIDDAGDKRRLIYRRPPQNALVSGVYSALTFATFVRSPSQTVFPVALTRSVGGFGVTDPAGQGAEDWMLAARLAAEGVRFELRMRPSVAYRVHAGNYSNQRESHEASQDAVRATFPPPPARDLRLRLRW